MRARRRFGQHFLEPAWVDKVVAAIAPAPADRVIEIGPGRGALTVPLAMRVATLSAVEVDRDLAASLARRLAGRVRIIPGDFLSVDPDVLLGPGPGRGSLRVVGNLPYNVSSPIIFRLIELHRATGAFSDATLMLQREVGDRMAASPGTRESGVLSVMVQLDADVERLLVLPPGAFRPAPAVTSVLVRLRFRPPAVAVGDRALFEAMVRAIFTQRRKTLTNALRSFAGGRGLEPGPVLAGAGVDPSRRPETLHLAELARLADVLGAAPGPPVV